MRVRQQKYRTYSPEFRAEAVALMRRRDCTYPELAAELGVNQHTLRSWYMADAMARKKGKRPKNVEGEAPASESPDERMQRLERENAKLRKQVERLEEDRAILKNFRALAARPVGQKLPHRLA